MKTKVITLTLIATLFCIFPANAQWRFGITTGLTYNNYSIDTRYISDVHYTKAWGSFPGCNFPIGTFGFMAQYDIYHWFGFRTDLNWTFKNHTMSIARSTTNYEANNGYIQLPVMASFSIGNKGLKGFCNIGIYGAYWLYNDKSGTEEVLSTILDGFIYYDFSNDRDQRFDYGLAGSVGIEKKFKLLERNWSWQVETRIYYSTQSTQKHYMKAKDPRYNTTLALQSGLCYFF